MLLEDFKRILSSFADRPADLDARKGQLVIQVNDELIEAAISTEDGDVFVQEQGEDRQRAARWITNRIARIPQLAERLLEAVKETPHYVIPSGKLLDHLDQTAAPGEERALDAGKCALRILGRREAGVTSVLYLTSDAGEGKTTLINELARQQAALYRSKQASWLLVPISLGGRSFLRFDDVVAAALVNRYRFRQLFYDGFIELVRLGVIVPAFDGFEEMFVEGSSGEAVSALGGLVNSLKNSGTVLVAARKAFFEYQNFATQTKLFDTLGGTSLYVTFARLALERWSSDQFLRYAASRGVQHSTELYNRVAQQLTPEHPVLTRAVLVRRLVDVAREHDDLEALLQSIGSGPEDYFYHFVSSIVNREAHEKWLDKNSETAQPLLAVEEHHELLGQVALEMWIGSTDSLKADMLDAIADLFSDERRKSASVATQVRERLKQHSLIVTSAAARGSFSFDHEDYRHFYLGEALGSIMRKVGRADMTRALQVGQLDRDTLDHAAASFRRLGGDAGKACELLSELSAREPASSFARENAGSLSLSVVSKSGLSGYHFNEMTFPAAAMRGRFLQSCEFSKCYFHPTALDLSAVSTCKFVECEFERLELESSSGRGTVFDRCKVSSLYVPGEDQQFFGPQEIQRELVARGIELLGQAVEEGELKQKADEHVRLAEKTFRVFLRATCVNENVFRQRMGTQYSKFEGVVLRRLLHEGVLEEVQYLGSGNQRRFRMAVPMKVIESALFSNPHSLDDFISAIRKRDE